MVIKKYNKRQSHFVKEERVEEPPVKDSSSLKLILSFFYPTDDEILQSSQQTDRSSMKPWWIALMSRNINSLIQKRTKASEAREKRQPFCLFCYFIQKKKKNLPVDHQRWGKNRWKINYAKKDKLTLHADFVLSSARVRDEIHLHRHLPHRAVRWLTWTSTKKGNWKKSKWNSAKRDRGWGGGEMPPSYSERSGQDGETASECRETEAGTVVCPST